ncbi:unnamed protein product [Effrenium voratum]|nr:unnamed protein product [Effrenium voratum]|eukprot:CAMPEP_0181439646 /NCGR_PEP_ID=MMETSP1110-20121109/22540_1 /TAXON_ID=174948 /ORGANISM="Symbiodinium sp., Strain CCMP421" /LENGTH=645 /DNA_ID=CAMNT_0023563387 /DNA_START=68 /DNA_END=2005 /DNA_ORIENTATION=+
MSRALRWAFLLTPCLAVRDSVTDALRTEEDIPDGFDDFFSHFHVTPETHRAILPEHGDPAVTLSVVFALHPAASVLGLTLPPGYQLTDAAGLQSPGCPQVFAPFHLNEKSAYANETEAISLVRHVESCQVLNGLDAKGNSSDLEQKDATVMLTLKLVGDLPELSRKELAVDHGNGSIVTPMTWWYFHIRVLYPDRSPEPEVNRFMLHWASEANTMWEGETSFQSWPILGDWECAYSDWEGWGSCSARCGGGRRMLVRRPLLAPPSGRSCNDTIHPDPASCNEHPCHYSCQFHEEEIIKGECSATCGGGVRFSRKRFVIDGDNLHLCPQMGDQFSEELEPCNTEPCRAKCELAKTWTVVTPCDAVCGRGHFKVMKQVLQKEIDDESCIPEYKWLPCERQHCTAFTVSRTVPNLLPVPEDKAKLVLSWSQKTTSRKIVITAPLGYKFGEKDGKCTIHFHSLQPHLQSCKVGDTTNTIYLSFLTPLPPAETGGAQQGPSKHRYELGIDVTTPECPKTHWVADPIRNQIICDTDADKNRWVIQFLRDDTDAGAELKDSLGFITVWKEGIPVPKVLRLKAEPLLLEETPPAGKTTTTVTTTRMHVTDPNPHTETGIVMCMRDRDPGYCQDRTSKSDVTCGWQNVCQVGDD